MQRRSVPVPMYRDKSPDGNRDKGRCDREATPATVEAMKLPEPGRQVAACGRSANAACCDMEIWQRLRREQASILKVNSRANRAAAELSTRELNR